MEGQFTQATKVYYLLFLMNHVSQIELTDKIEEKLR